MSFDVPADLYYTESHEWVNPETGRIGITDFAQDELGDIVFVELPSAGDSFEEGEDFGVVESIKAVSDIYMPVSGDVVDAIADLEGEPELINDDPFGDGWLIEVELTDESELDDLLSPEEYEAQL